MLISYQLNILIVNKKNMYSFFIDLYINYYNLFNNNILIILLINYFTYKLFYFRYTTTRDLIIKLSLWARIF